MLHWIGWRETKQEIWSYVSYWGEFKEEGWANNVPCSSGALGHSCTSAEKYRSVSVLALRRRDGPAWPRWVRPARASTRPAASSRCPWAMRARTDNTNERGGHWRSLCARRIRFWSLISCVGSISEFTVHLCHPGPPLKHCASTQLCSTSKICFLLVLKVLWRHLGYYFSVAYLSHKSALQYLGWNRHTSFPHGG